MRKKSAYFVGIKGVAMTALAVYLKEKGYRVTGSDVEDKFATDLVLEKNKVKVVSGFTPLNIKEKYDFVVVTGAHGGMTNPEAIYAQESGLPTFMHGQMLGEMMKENESISIAGCHGKTTTSALTASLLTHAGLDPSYAVGTAYINDLGWGGHYGKGKYFVAEADEYMTCPLTCRTPRFLWQNPKILIITNIDYDHPDAYSNLGDIYEAFLKLVNKLPKGGTLIACLDDKNVRNFLSQVEMETLTYGFSSNADYRIDRFYFGEGASFMSVSYRGVKLGEFMIRVSGRHNLLNALAASISANLSGVSWEKIKNYIKLFTGTKRRLEKIGEVGGVYLYDDYAHHPSEIVATIAGVKSWFPKKRLIVVFQPHTFSRTKALFYQFAKSFKETDLSVITSIYPSAREKADRTIHSGMLVSAANKYKKNVVHASGQKEVIAYLEKNLRSGDVVLTMGAGDIFLWHPEIIKLLKHLRKSKKI